MKQKCTGKTFSSGSRKCKTSITL